MLLVHCRQASSNHNNQEQHHIIYFNRQDDGCCWIQGCLARVVLQHYNEAHDGKLAHIDIGINRA